MKKKHCIALLVIAVFSLVMRIWLLDHRWINADEGAHMMDAVLTLEGKVPNVDFASRQPVYTWSLATAFKIMGGGYFAGRALVMLLSLLVSLPIFFLARSIYDDRIACLATALYLLLPLEILNSVIVKTEPLSMIIVSLSFLSVIRSTEGHKPVWLIVAGVLAATGYYVRQSALVVPPSVVLFLALYGDVNAAGRLKHILFFITGYVLTVTLVFLFYLQFLGLTELMRSDLNPLIFVVKPFERLFSLWGSSSGAVSVSADQLPAAGQDQYRLYLKYIKQAFSMHLFLCTGMLVSALQGAHKVFIQKQAGFRDSLSILLYFWVCLLALAYAYYFGTRGFYIDYFREFFPPLVILFSAGLYSSCSAVTKGEDGIRFSAVMGGIAVVVFFTMAKFKGIIPTKGVMLGFMVIYMFWMFRKWKSRTIGSHALTAIMAIGLIVVIFGHNLSYMANRLNLRYDSNWSPTAVKKTAAYIRNNTSADETIMSGAVIWELQARRKPVAQVSHPLELEFKIPEARRIQLENEIREQPPKIIVMDGFTQKTYFRQFPWLENLIKSDYELGVTASPARVPVTVYKRRASHN